MSEEIRVSVGFDGSQLTRGMATAKGQMSAFEMQAVTMNRSMDQMFGRSGITAEGVANLGHATEKTGRIAAESGEKLAKYGMFAGRLTGSMSALGVSSEVVAQGVTIATEALSGMTSQAALLFGGIGLVIAGITTLVTWQAKLKKAADDATDALIRQAQSPSYRLTPEARGVLVDERKDTQKTRDKLDRQAYALEQERDMYRIGGHSDLVSKLNKQILQKQQEIEKLDARLLEIKTALTAPQAYYPTASVTAYPPDATVPRLPGMTNPRVPATGWDFNQAMRENDVYQRQRRDLPNTGRFGIYWDREKSDDVVKDQGKKTQEQINAQVAQLQQAFSGAFNAMRGGWKNTIDWMVQYAIQELISKVALKLAMNIATGGSAALGEGVGVGTETVPGKSYGGAAARQKALAMRYAR